MEYRNAPFYQKMDLESIFGFTWWIYRKDFLHLFSISLLMSLLLQAITYLGFPETLNQAFAIMANPQSANIDPGLYLNFLYLMGTYLVVYAAMYLLLYGYLIAVYLNPGTPVINEMIQLLSRRFFPFLLLMIVLTVIILAGSVLGVFLFVIGMLLALLFLGTVFFPAPAIMLLEELRPFDVIARSFKLVLKDFWRILGFLVIFFLILMLVNLIFSAITMAPYSLKFIQTIGSGSGAETGATAYRFSMIYLLLNSIFGALLVPFTPIYSFLVYFHLKAREDENLAS